MRGSTVRSGVQSLGTHGQFSSWLNKDVDSARCERHRGRVLGGRNQYIESWGMKFMRLRESRWLAGALGARNQSIESWGMKFMRLRESRWLPATLVAVLWAGLATSSFAQSTPPATPAAAATGRVAGKVTEKGKDPIAYANVIVLGTKQGAQTDESG